MDRIQRQGAVTTVIYILVL